MSSIARVLKSETSNENEVVETVEMHFSENKFCEQINPSGEDSPPLPEDRVLIVEVEGTGNYVSSGVLADSKGANPGEKILYSRDSDGNLTAKIHLKNDGSIFVDSQKDVEINLKGNVTVSADENATLNVSGNITLNITGDTKLTVDGNVDLEATKVTVTGDAKFTGGQFEVGGSVAPTGSGALCGLPNCCFTGAPQCGNISQGT